MYNDIDTLLLDIVFLHIINSNYTAPSCFLRFDLFEFEKIFTMAKLGKSRCCTDRV